jgi:hypothetical protein
VWTERILQEPQPGLNLTDEVARVVLGMVLDLPPREEEEDGAEGEERPPFSNVEDVLADILHPTQDDPRLSRGERRLEALLHLPGFNSLYRDGATHPLHRYDERPVFQNGRAWYPRPRRKVVNPLLCRLHLLRMDAQQHRCGWLRNLVYCVDQMWDQAPFLPDGTVDWALTDAAGSLMCKSGTGWG